MGNTNYISKVLAILIDLYPGIASSSIVIEHSILVPELDNVEGRYLQNSSRFLVWNIDNLFSTNELLLAHQWIKREYLGLFNANLWLCRQIPDVFSLRTTRSVATLDHVRSSWPVSIRGNSQPWRVVIIIGEDVIVKYWETAIWLVLLVTME